MARYLKSHSLLFYRKKGNEWTITRDTVAAAAADKVRLPPRRRLPRSPFRQLKINLPRELLPENLAITTYGQHALPVPVAEGVQGKLLVRVRQW